MRASGNRPRPAARRGFTLLELMISASVVSVLFYGIATTTIAASNAYEESMARSRMVSRAHQVMDRIADEFVEAELGTMSAAPEGVGASTLTYRVPESFAGPVITWSPNRRIDFLMEPGELDDGIDNNGDGRVDEGTVVLTLDIGEPDERQVTLAHHLRSLLGGEVSNLLDDNGNLMVDERGLTFELSGNVLTIRMTFSILDEGGRTITKSVQTSVRVRN